MVVTDRGTTYRFQYRTAAVPFERFMEYFVSVFAPHNLYGLDKAAHINDMFSARYCKASWWRLWICLVTNTHNPDSRPLLQPRRFLMTENIEFTRSCFVTNLKSSNMKSYSIYRSLFAVFVVYGFSRVAALPEPIFATTSDDFTPATTAAPLLERQAGQLCGYYNGDIGTVTTLQSSLDICP